MTCGLEAVIRFAESTSCRPCFCDLVTGAQSFWGILRFLFSKINVCKTSKTNFYCLQTHEADCDFWVISTTTIKDVAVLYSGIINLLYEVWFVYSSI